MERLALLERIVDVLKNQKNVLACWEGGSAAFGQNDMLSDIDCQAFLDSSEAVAHVLQALETTLAELPGIRFRYEVPQPAWHGHFQCFYIFENSSPFHMLDLVLMHQKQNMFLETERHGTPHVFFDHAQICVPQAWDRTANQLKIKARVQQIQNSFAVFHHLVDKEIQRNRPIDAMHFYSGSLISRLVEVARMVHCPDRYDYSARYLKRDLPGELYNQIEPLFYVSDLNDLAFKKQKLCDLFYLLAIQAANLPN